MRYICISDVHGCFLELKELIEKIKPTEDDVIISLGDVCDRGDDPAKCYNLLIQLGARMCRANHESKLIRWRRREAEVKSGIRKKNEMQLKDIHKASIRDIDSHPNSARLWRYITDEAEDMICFDAGGKKYACVHAGLHPSDGLKTHPKVLMRIRRVDPDTLESIQFKPEKPDEPEKGVFWADLWKGPERVIFGHNVFPEVTYFPYAVGLDTGCVFGGSLTALIVNPDGVEEIVSVKAKQVYYTKGQY